LNSNIIIVIIINAEIKVISEEMPHFYSYSCVTLLSCKDRSNRSEKNIDLKRTKWI